MQEVYRDGTLGAVKDFSAEELKQALMNAQVDHVRVFERDNGNKVGIPEISEMTLDNAIDRKLQEREERKKLKEQYKILTREFDRKVARHFR